MPSAEPGTSRLALASIEDFSAAALIHPACGALPGRYAVPGARGVPAARCLTEGIDVPSLDAVAFVDPRSSAVDIVQAVGRVMRTAPGKQLGHVIVPVFLTEESFVDPEAAIESSAFAPVLTVLRALRAHDPDLVSDATRIATSLGGRDALAGGHISEHIQFLGHAVDVRRFDQALEMRFVEVSKDRWEVGLEQLRSYEAATGHASPHARQLSEHGFRLGSWVNKCRTNYKLGLLSPGRIAALETVPGWTWDPHADVWQDGLEHLSRYVDREGHRRVPRGHAEDGFRLGGWVNDQRHRGLTDERRLALEALPGWAWAHGGTIGRRRWRISTAMERQGHTRVPRAHVEDGFPLGHWVNTRRAWRRNGRLSAARQRDLESVPGWVWDPFEHDWQEGLAHLHGYVARVGHAMVPEAHTEAGFNLGGWVRRRRAEHRDGRLDPDKADALASLPRWTLAPRKIKWQRGVDNLRAFAEETGHTRVPSTYVAGDGFRLGNWVVNQRQAHRRGELPRERATALESVPDWAWSPHEAAWQEGLAHLRAYVGEKGDAKPPVAYVSEDGYRLGAWVVTRRSHYRLGGLSAEQESDLEAVAGWSAAVRDLGDADQQDSRNGP